MRAWGEYATRGMMQCCMKVDTVNLLFLFLKGASAVGAWAARRACTAATRSSWTACSAGSAARVAWTEQRLIFFISL